MVFLTLVIDRFNLKDQGQKNYNAQNKLHVGMESTSIQLNNFLFQLDISTSRKKLYSRKELLFNQRKQNEKIKLSCTFIYLKLCIGKMNYHQHRAQCTFLSAVSLV